MNAARNYAAGGNRGGGPLARIASRLGGRISTFVTLLILIALFALAFSVAWKRWGGVVSNHPKFVLDDERLQITAQPDWIKGDVKRDVMRDGSLGDLRVLDPQVTVRVARAFGLHTWVSDVKRVRKEHPGRVFVDLEYRRPVAMVEVLTQGQRGLLPVDRKGVLLPPQDFTAEETREYIRIAVGDTLPVGPVGTPWGDDRVTGAAHIAGDIGERWKGLELTRVSVRPNEAGGRRRPDELIYDVFTRQGSRIVWGHSGGFERATEATSAEKVDRLVRFFADRTLRTGETLDIDVQGKSGLTVSPLTASLPHHRTIGTGAEHEPRP